MMYSYTALYETIVNQQQQQIAKPARWAFWFLVALSWIVTLQVWALNPEQWRLLLGLGVALTLAWLASIGLLWLLYLAWLGSHNPLRNAHKLAARLLLAERSLTTGVRGLTEDDLTRLRRIAEIEQAAADWRGNVINLVIVGLLFGTLSLLLNPPAEWPRWQAAIQEASETPVTINLPVTTVALPPLASAVLDSVSFIVMGIILFFVVIRLAKHFGRFIGSEANNRLILLACAEAESVLAIHGDSMNQIRSLTDKRRLAHLLGFRLRGTFIHTLRTPLFVDEAKRAWHLEPLNEPISLRGRFHQWEERFFLRQ